MDDQNVTISRIQYDKLMRPLADDPAAVAINWCRTHKRQQLVPVYCVWFQTHDYGDRRAELEAGRRCDIVTADVVLRAAETGDADADV